jgi:glycosyltransferase involved in cell wall biosynthesis
MYIEGNKVYIVTPSERRFEGRTGIIEQDGIQILTVRTFNIQKTSFIEKGLGTILLEYQFHWAIMKYLSTIRFDLILYSTPPITLTKIISSVKKRSGAVTYLLLKDIFPQNAVDLGMINKRGLLYKYFRHKEKNLYKVSDYIGCMSPANIKYVLSNNSELNSGKVELCPNSIEIISNILDYKQKESLRNKFNIPTDSTIFIYGGNLGKPQGLDFLLQVLLSTRNQKRVFFIIIGTGTEYPKVQKWFDIYHPGNAMLMPGLPKVEYDNLVQACDVGLVFLDKRFSIPNYPSRLLSYLENKMPIIVATDLATDIGSIAEENGYGLWSFSGDTEKTTQHILLLAGNSELRRTMGESGYNYLKENYSVDSSYRIILKHFCEVR